MVYVDLHVCDPVGTSHTIHTAGSLADSFATVRLMSGSPSRNYVTFFFDSVGQIDSIISGLQSAATAFEEALPDSKETT